MDTGTDITAIHRKEYEISDSNERIIVTESPGKMHLLGEHSRNGEGIYLSAGIDKFVQVAVSARKDTSLRFFTAQACERKRTTIMNVHYKREDRWANHIKIAICLFAEKGETLRGMNWTISSSIPQKIGLGAASAIEIAAALALRRYFNSSISNEELLSRLSALHKEFYNGEDKTIDYLIMLNARKDTFLLIDEMTRSVHRIKNPMTKYKIFLVDSKVPFMGIEEEVRLRRTELERGFELIAKKRQVKTFRDCVGIDMLELMGAFNESARRRSMHAVKELIRAHEIAGALESGDIPSISRIIFHSHESLRDLYEVTCPELDWLVKRAQELPGVACARMTGKGFGGCVFVFLCPSVAEEYLAKMEDYERIFGFHAVIYEIKPAAGVRLLTK